MSGLRTAVLIVVLVAAVLCGCLFLVGLNAEGTLFSREYYRGLVDEISILPNRFTT